jgi:hypothetical protein
MKITNIIKKQIITVCIIATVIVLNIILVSLGTSQVVKSIIPPVARKIPKIDTIHNDILVDNYFWLKERENPEVMEYLHAENEYTSEMMKHTEEFQEKLYEEMLSRIQETDLSVPEKVDSYYYYKRTEQGKQYPVYCRKKWSLDHDEEILLDQNVLAGRHEYLEIGALKVSPDHSLLAYSVDTTGSEHFVLYIKDLRTKELSNEHLSNTGYSIAWTNDNKTLFYTTLDNAKRPYKLHRHILGNDQTEDEMVTLGKPLLEPGEDLEFAEYLLSLSLNQEQDLKKMDLTRNKLIERIHDDIAAFKYLDSLVFPISDTLVEPPKREVIYEFLPWGEEDTATVKEQAENIKELTQCMTVYPDVLSDIARAAFQSDIGEKEIWTVRRGVYALEVKKIHDAGKKVARADITQENLSIYLSWTIKEKIHLLID